MISDEGIKTNTKIQGGTHLEKKETNDNNVDTTTKILAYCRKITKPQLGLFVR